MNTVSDTLVKEYVLLSRRVHQQRGKHVVPVVQNGKFFEVYDVRHAEASRLLTICERVLHLKVIRKQKLTVHLTSLEEVRLVGSDGEGLLAMAEKHAVFCAGFQMESVAKYRDILIEKGYTLLPIVQSGGGRTVRTLESAGTYTVESTAGVLLVTEDTLHVARYDASLNVISMAERERPSDLHAALDDARSLLAELGGCRELEVHADETDDDLCLALRDVFTGETSTYARPLRTRRKFLCDRRWLRRALETHYTWITQLGEDVIAKLGMQDAAVHHVAVLVLLVAFLHDHDAHIGALLPIPNVRASEGTMRFPSGMSALHIFDAPVDNCSICNILSEHVHTAMGRRCLRERLASPSTDVDAIRARLSDIPRGLCLVEEGAAIERWTRGMHDLEKLSCAVCRGRLGAGDVSKLVDAHDRAQRVVEALPDPALCPSEDHLHALWRFTAYLVDTFDVDDSCDVFTKGPTAPEELIRARIRVGRATDAVEAVRMHYNECVADLTRKHSGAKPTGGAFVAVDTKNGQTHLLLASSHASLLRSAGHALRSYTKDQCAIDDDNARAALHELDDARSSLREIHSDALTSACAHMRALYFDAHGHAVAHAIGNVDMVRGLALFFAKANYCAPEVRNATEAGVVVSALRHPLVERLVDRRGVAYVANDVRLGPDEGWLLYGVNSAGKSSFLKAIALAVYMAQCGLYVPASSMSFAPYETIALHIGGGDDIFRHQSTFVKEVEQLRGVLRASNDHGARLLFLADELGNSTEDTSAVKLVASLLYTLVHRRTTVALATHMFALQTNPFVQGLTTVRNKHIAVAMDTDPQDTIVFERKLRDGLPDVRDYGCRIARLLLREDDTMVNTMRSDYHTACTDRALTGASRYNRDAIAQTCDHCGHQPKANERPLHWHHIGEQQDADAYGKLPNGLSVHSLVNLARLCESCHHRLHNGTMSVERVLETDRGRTLIMQDLPLVVSVPPPSSKSC